MQAYGLLCSSVFVDRNPTQDVALKQKFLLFLFPRYLIMLGQLVRYVLIIHGLGIMWTLQKFWYSPR